MKIILGFRLALCISGRYPGKLCDGCISVGICSPVKRRPSWFQFQILILKVIFKQLLETIVSKNILKILLRRIFLKFSLKKKKNACLFPIALFALLYLPLPLDYKSNEYNKSCTFCIEMHPYLVVPIFQTHVSLSQETSPLTFPAFLFLSSNGPIHPDITENLTSASTAKSIKISQPHEIMM